MRNRALVLIAFTAAVVLPSVSAAQRRLPGIRRRPAPAAPLPPQIPEVTKAMSYHRSRFSAEGYSLVSAYNIPDASGASSYISFGSGTHADFRLREHLSAGIDVTSTFFGSPVTAQTAEGGMRVAPLSREATLRPFFDLRAAYMNLSDQYQVQGSGLPNSQYEQFGRYSSGVGGIAGFGVERSISRSFAIATEMLGMRTRMTTYRFAGTGTVPAGMSYTMTSFRYTLGIKYNRTTPVRTSGSTAGSAAKVLR